MLKYSANYSITDNNFVIQNLKIKPEFKDEYYPVLCILKNIIQRGLPTYYSEYLQNKLGDNKQISGKSKLSLISKKRPTWTNYIKGHEETNDFVAAYFFNKIIEQYLPNYAFILQLLLPEARLNDITEVQNQEFEYQQVDFYLPQAKLVIEIDGIQHQQIAERISDYSRDEYLKKYGIKVIRINSYDIKNTTLKLNQKIEEIKDTLLKYKEKLNPYNYFLEFDIQNEERKKDLFGASIMRFQVLLLELMCNNYLDLKKTIWRIAIKEDDISDFEEDAIEDIMLWLFHLCKIAKVDFIRPQISIIRTEELDETSEVDVKIDFSLLSRWTDENKWHPDVIFVRGDYYEGKNYFKVSTTDLITYDIVTDGKDSMKPSMLFLLKNIFGFDDFRLGQERIIINTLKLHNTIGLLPTGAGKSICYQYAAILQPCISFCVSPIKSLMYDQKENLDQKGITRTEYITSDVLSERRELIQKGFATGKFLMIWISPERFQNEQFRNYLDQLNKVNDIVLGLATIDEVHCMSEWGHGFRTSYLNLIKTIFKYCPTATLLGLTATASLNVLKNIMIEFEMNNRDDVISIPKFTRDELHFNVLRCDKNINKEKQLIDRLELYKKKIPNIFITNGNETRCGIIFTPYVNGKNGCYELNKIIKKTVSKCDFYSGEKPKKLLLEDIDFNDYKKIVQTEFKHNQLSVLVATKAFGMGIDKANIRYTIHYGLPSSLEALYQEAGRAGRDRKNAECMIIYEPESGDARNYLSEIFDPQIDVVKLKQIMEELNPSKKIENNWIEWRGKDVYNQLMLLINGVNDFSTDKNLTDIIIEHYARPNNVATFCLNDILKERTRDKCTCEENTQERNTSVVAIEKILYHLSTIGIVRDWIISGWKNAGTPITVYFENYSDSYIVEKTIAYIRKFDPKFTFLDRNDRYKTYNDIWLQGNESIICRIYKIFWQWYYDEIVYSRRQALQTVMEACDDFTVGDAEKFKTRMESYFALNNYADKLGVITDNPSKHSLWFEFFSKEYFQKAELDNMINTLGRFLESNRYNTGLNLISALLRFMKKDYDSNDSRPRLIQALRDINNLEQYEKEEIINTMLEISKEYLDNEGKEIVSSIILKEISLPKLGVTIYQVLEDNYSLNYIVENAEENIQKYLKEIKKWLM